MRIGANHLWDEYFSQCKKLIQTKNWSALAQSLPSVLRLARNLQQHQDFVRILEPIENQLLLTQQHQLVFAELLLCARAFEKALGVLETLVPIPKALALYALALLRCSKPIAALEQAQAALGTGFRHDLAFRVISLRVE